MKIRHLIFLLLITTLNNSYAFQNESYHSGIKYFNIDCLQLKPDSFSKYNEKIKTIISSAMLNNGLKLRTDQIAKTNPATSIETAYLCFTLHANDTGTGYAVTYQLEVRQFAFLVKDLQSKGSMAEPIKLNTATDFFVNHLDYKKIDILLEEIKITANNMAASLSKINNLK